MRVRQILLRDENLYHFKRPIREKHVREIVTGVNVRKLYHPLYFNIVNKIEYVQSTNCYDYDLI